MKAWASPLENVLARETCANTTKGMSAQVE